MGQDSKILSAWGRIFGWLRWISVFQYVRMIPLFKGSYGFVEAWVIGNLIASMTSYGLALYNKSVPSLAIYFIMAYGFIRVFEVTVYQVNVLLFDPYQTENYAVKSYRRLVILLLHNYVEVIIWFAAAYVWLANLGKAVIPLEAMTTPFGTFMYSFLTMVGFGSNSINTDMLKNITIWHSVLVVQAIIGLFMTLICLARFVSLLPAPDTMNPQEQKAEAKELQQELALVNEQLAEVREIICEIKEKQQREEQGELIRI
ncbi:hypothetical protein DFP93_10855 [Aneurinibacillus soli]|uniref:Uncharacterized protein n=1 Tax=Aneurinibacillus soli TaxID=1500254 RepID=A0A0U5C4D5_9BACL|nr:FlxA-like family protein [Aneurinibacillus soli]PYE61482.1 hypothetical protein DFP93_10855 [Aneurinibacillus soli]BAU26563.1 hypothetical protein CB4_00690 [Aneurinibacillus soli]